VTDDAQSKIKKLHNIGEKLHNSGRPTDAEKRVIASTSKQDVVIKPALEAQTHETEKWDLERRQVVALERWVQLQQERQHVEPHNVLSFTKDELDRYVAHRKEGLTMWMMRAILKGMQTGWPKLTTTISINSLADGRPRGIGNQFAFLQHLEKQQCTAV